ncbi:MAG: hypothetical protein B2I17_10040 [Thermoplasmatales archaeon B_DKE]|nr:MAG: hypothetical protein B2I17_10040 [Thermoplasmatales archaeon B_DKE]
MTEISESEERIRRIGNSAYLVIPAYLVKSKRIVRGDPVSVRLLSDGSLKIVFQEKGDDEQ